MNTPVSNQLKSTEFEFDRTQSLNMPKVCVVNTCSFVVILLSSSLGILRIRERYDIHDVGVRKG